MGQSGKSKKETAFRWWPTGNRIRSSSSNSRRTAFSFRQTRRKSSRIAWLSRATRLRSRSRCASAGPTIRSSICGTRTGSPRRRSAPTIFRLPPSPRPPPVGRAPAGAERFPHRTWISFRPWREAPREGARPRWPCAQCLS